MVTNSGTPMTGENKDKYLNEDVRNWYLHNIKTQEETNTRMTRE